MGKCPWPLGPVRAHERLTGLSVHVELSNGKVSLVLEALYMNAHAKVTATSVHIRLSNGAFSVVHRTSECTCKVDLN